MYKLIEKFLLSPFYVILISAYPSLAIYTNNIGQIYETAFFRPLAVSLILSFFAYQITIRFIRDAHRAALLVSLGQVFFFAYGHLFNNFLEDKSQFFILFMDIIWVLLMLICIGAAYKYIKPYKITLQAPTLNMVAIVLLMFPIARIFKYNSFEGSGFIFKTDNFQPLTITAPQTQPDIYYIILDAYGRSDAIKKQYGYDNTPFINALEEMGFYVADCSQANYSITMLSLTSSLNMDYIPNLSDHFIPQETDRFYLFKALKQNAVHRTLEAAGYTTVAFATGFPWTEIQTSDIFYAPDSTNGLASFESVILKTTLARILEDLGWLNFEDISSKRHLERMQTTLSHFDALAQVPGPKFVFMHIVSPHPPYIFDAQGNILIPSMITDQNGYPAQAEFIGNQVAAGVKKIIESSVVKPIIIIQGDHGSFALGDQERLPILNAYYLPGHNDLLYPNISPVNTFRIILNTYLNANYPLLDDKSYIMTLPYAYSYTEAPNTCQDK